MIYQTKRWMNKSLIIPNDPIISFWNSVFCLLSKLFCKDVRIMQIHAFVKLFLGQNIKWFTVFTQNLFEFNSMSVRACVDLWLAGLDMTVCCANNKYQTIVSTTVSWQLLVHHHNKVTDSIYGINQKIFLVGKPKLSAHAHGFLS